GGRVDLDRFNGVDLTPILLTSGVLAPPNQLPTLTLTPSANVITWGDTVELKVAFGSVGANRTITFQASSDGLNWQPIATMTTDASGNASMPYRSATNLSFRGAFDGAPDLVPVAGDASRVAVRQVALLRPTSGGTTRVISRGRRVTFTTTVRPIRLDLAPAKVTFAIYRRVSGAWVHFTDRNVY